MSGLDDDSATKRHDTSPEARHLWGMMVKIHVTLTRKPSWSGEGSTLLDGKTRENVEAVCFSGIGFYSRPESGANAEAIVAHMGGPNTGNSAIIATRDEELRKAVLGEGELGGTAMYNRSTVVYCRKSGRVEIRTPSGDAFPLPTLEEHNDLVAKYNQLREAFNLFLGHQHQGTNAGGLLTTVMTTAPSGAPPPTPVPVEPAAQPATGTTVLSAQ